MPAKIEEGSEYDKARIRKIVADAQLVEVNLSHARGELCATQAVIEAWQQVLTAFSARITTIPTKMAPMLANESDPKKIKMLLEAAAKEALDELSNYKPEVDPISTTNLTNHDQDEDEEAPKRGRGRPSKMQQAKEKTASSRKVRAKASAG